MKSCKLQVLFGSECSKGEWTAPRCVFLIRDSRMAETCEVLVAVSETSDMSHDVSFPCCFRGTRAGAYHEG